MYLSVTARCLHTVSEDNPDFCSADGSADLTQILAKLLCNEKDYTEYLLLKTLAIGKYIFIRMTKS